MSGGHSLLSAHSVTELTKELDGLAPKVLSRAAGVRTTRTRELWILQRYLAQRMLIGDLTFPLSVDAGDRPDFRIVEGIVEYGLEVTEAIHTIVAKAREITAREGIKVYSEGALARKRSRVPNSSAALRAHLNDPSKQGDLYVGSEVERELEALLSDRLDAKLKALNKPDFRRLASNRLLIYENSGLPNIVWQNVNLAALRRINSESPQVGYDRISILSGSGEGLIEV